MGKKKKLQKKKGLNYMEEDSDSEQQEHDERLSEDRETIPQGVQSAEESGSEEREVDESSGSLREKANGEVGSDSEGNEVNNHLENSSHELDQAHEESSSHDGVENAEISEDEPLVRMHFFLHLSD